MTAERYLSLTKNIYYDTKEKVIVQHLGKRYVFLRHDRRSKATTIAEAKRTEDIITKGLLKVQGTLYFDARTKKLYKKTSNKMVLFTKDRRKISTKTIIDRRKKVL